MRPTTVPSEAIDPRCLERLRAMLGTEAAYRGILVDFMVSSASLGAELRLALPGRRIQEAGRAAHTLKSMARLVGAIRLGEACHEVEQMSRSGQPIAPTALQAAIAHLDATRAAVGRRLA